jgi:hypothetical protein
VDRDYHAGAVDAALTAATGRHLHPVRREADRQPESPRGWTSAPADGVAVVNRKQADVVHEPIEEPADVSFR